MKLWILLPLLCGYAAAETYTYWVQPCPKSASRKTGCNENDPELAQWALEAWQDAANGAFSLARSDDENHSLLRIYWAAGTEQLYGEARPLVVDGQPGAAIYVRPKLEQLGPDIAAAGRKDRLFRDTIVYLTCLHESGHAFGLPHTANFDDIMYSFAFGGDIVEYFARYRRKLTSRDDIQRHAGMSASDRKYLTRLHSR